MRKRSSSSKLRLAAVIVTVAAAAVIAVLVACPPPAPRQPSGPVGSGGARSGRPAGEPAQLEAFRSPPRRAEPMGKLAVILDDAGYSLSELEPFLELPGPLTIAVLPNLPHSAEAARRVLAAGKDLILHCPMEAEGDDDPGPGALRVGMSEEQIDRLLSSDFASVPAAGMNNHMGSRATADPALMEAVLSYLKRTGRYFVDSRTTPDTVGPAIAQKLGVPFLQRSLFIDDERSEKAIANAFQAGIQEARTRGAAVVIGHVQNKGVLDILRAGRRDLAGSDVRLARLAEILGESPTGESAF